MSNEESKSQDKKRKQLLSDIKSDDFQKVVKAIKAMEAHGNASVVEPMLSVWLTSQNDEIDSTMQNFFADLKDSTTKEPIMQFLNSCESMDFRKKILTAIWNSKVDYSDYLKDFVFLAADGDFLEALECLTVIENLDGPFPEDHFLESQLYLKEYLETRNSSNDHKAELMSEIALLIKNFESNQIDI